jgi:hypothetical protein
MPRIKLGSSAARLGAADVRINFWLWITVARLPAPFLETIGFHYKSRVKAVYIPYLLRESLLYTRAHEGTLVTDLCFLFLRLPGL